MSLRFNVNQLRMMSKEMVQNFNLAYLVSYYVPGQNDE
jgi:hypothetical protein